MGCKETNNTAAEAENMIAARKTLAAKKAMDTKKAEAGVAGLMKFLDKKAKDEPAGQFFKVYYKGIPYQNIYASSIKIARKILVKRGLRKFKVVPMV